MASDTKEKKRKTLKDVEIKAMKRDKEGHYIMIKGSIQETIINIYVPNIGAQQYVRQMLTMTE